MKNVSKTKLLTLVLTIVMLIGIIAVVVSANDNVSESTTDTVYTNELPGINGDYYDKISTGYRLDKVSGNNLALSTLNSKYFTFESDVTFVEGTNTSFVFGAKSSDWSDTISNKKAFFGLAFMKNGTTIKMKMYQEYGLWAGIIPEATVLTNVQGNTVKLKIAYQEDNKFRVYINGEELSFSFGTKAGYTEADFVSLYQGGYFGLMTFNSTVKYENLTLAVPQGNYDNSLPSVNNINGYSVLSDKTGYEMKYFAGNNILVSGAKTKHFTFEADVNIKQGSSGALVFGAQEKKCASIGKLFGLEFKKSSNKVYIKLFQDGGGLGDNVIPGSKYYAEIENATDAFHIRVNYDKNDKLNIYVNEQKIEYSFGTATNKTEKDFLNAYKGGYVGLLTHKANVEFKNIKLYDTDYIEYNNDIPNLQGKDLTSLAEGYVVKNNGNNNFLISEVNSREFEYNLTAKILSGDRFSLIFGSETNDANLLVNHSKSFLGIEFKKTSSGINIAFFREKSSTTSGKTYISSSLVTSINSSEFDVSVSFTESNGFKISINGEAIDLSNLYAQGMNPNADYNGGYFGILTFKSKVSFSNIKLTTPMSEPKFNTNLTSLSAINGTWNITDDGLYSQGSGDNFALSETVASDFIYEADVTFAEGATGAASLVFRSTDAPGKSSYVANIDKGKGNIRIFEFGGATIGQATINEQKSTYHMRVIALGTALMLYVDGELVISETATNLTSGKLGLLTYNATVTYQNVNYREITKAEFPTLTNLTVSADGVALSPTFSTDTYSYSVELPRDITKFNLRASFTNEITASYKLIQSGVNVTSGTLTSENSVEITAPYGVSTLLLNTTKGDILATYMLEITNRYDYDYMASEAYRPQIHFTPEINFMNDPNGLVYDTSNNTWHMFFQYSPQLDKMGNQTWGHAVSDDLINWVELPVAIPITNRGAVFSGSAVSLTAEEARKTPFFTEDDIAKAATGEGSLLVALYTTVRPSQEQSVAYSTDHGVTWTQYPEYAIQHEYTSDRDPKVFKIKGDDRWYLIVAGGYARLYVSENLADWTLVQDLTWSDGSLVNSECPDMYPLAVLDRNGNKTGETKWIYNASSEWYIIGDMVWNDEVGAYNYVAEEKLSSQTAGASNAYAAQSYYNDPSGRRITVHWLQDYSTTNGILKRWNGVQSLPLETTLVKYDNGTYAIWQNPVSEVEELRGNKLYVNYDFVIAANDVNILSGLTAQVYEVILTVDMTKTTSDEFGFEFRITGSEKVVYKYNALTNTLIMDKRNSPIAYQADTLSWSLAPDSNGKIKLRALVDNSVLEFFGNDGEAHLIDLYYASQDAVGMSFYSNSGNVYVDSLEIYECKSMYTGKNVSESINEMYIAISPSGYNTIGEEFAVEISVYPMTNIGAIVWNIPDGLTKISEGANYITLIGDKHGEYTVEATLLGKTVHTTIMLDDKNFNTNLSGWSAISGSWENSYEGIYGNNSSSNDSFYMSDVGLPTNIAWTYEADIRIESGKAAGLVFGVKDKSSPGNHWLCLNSDATESDGIFKLFKNTGSQSWVKSSPHGVFSDTKSYHLRIEYDGAGTFVYKIAHYGTNDYLITNSYTDNSFTSITGNLYFGLVTCRSNSYFDNVVLSISKPEINFTPKTSITLGSELVYNVYVPVVDYMKSFTVDGTTYENLIPVTLDDGNQYYHISVPLAASKAARNLLLKATVSIDGNDYNGTWTMSIPKYAKKVIESSNVEEEVILVKDVLAYIKAAYVYFDAEDKAGICKIIDEILVDYNRAFSKTDGVTDTENGLWSVVIALEEKPSIRFVLPEGATADNYTFKSGNKTLEYTTGTITIGDKTYNYAEVSLYAYQVIKEITYSDGTNSGSYHINSYYDFVTTDEELKTDVNLTTLVEKLYNYCKSAENYRAFVTSK